MSTRASTLSSTAFPAFVTFPPIAVSAIPVPAIAVTTISVTTIAVTVATIVAPVWDNAAGQHHCRH
ncbi:hypothetical protein [Geomonas azotofigens]|uniref:hypothetical protein n=1 Tax=Geomonas azotofigens TaxID=2843196 RepID=UPI001C10333F|nr:hypothetical protein [Geomonas azotofigens]MBU5614694.1 hypothetical protein [Geomonas azotofigens]